MRMLIWSAGIIFPAGKRGNILASVVCKLLVVLMKNPVRLQDSVCCIKRGTERIYFPAISLRKVKDPAIGSVTGNP